MMVQFWLQECTFGLISLFDSIITREMDPNQLKTQQRMSISTISQIPP
jgi:hypothetical protein